MDTVLYYSPIACSLVPYVTLTEAGADFEVRNINLRKGQQSSPDYLKLNPKHKVPVLMVDGQVLTENVAIQLWIARNFPEAKLLPTDPWQELKAISIMSWCASGIHPFLARTNAPPKVCDVRGTEDSVKKLAADQPREVDLVGAQEPPDVLNINVAERLGQERAAPAGIAPRRRLIQQR
jgi:glutathione S-transferase